MGTETFQLTAFLIALFLINCHAVLFDEVPKILVHDGHLILQSASDKNITIHLKGDSWLNVNDIDVLKVLNGFGASAKHARPSSGIISGPEVSYEVQLYTLRSALFGEKGLEERVIQLENATRVGRINFRFRNLQQRLRRLENKIETLLAKASEDNCRSNPCQNGGTCIDLYDTFTCKCPSNWEGTTCGTDVNECAEFAGTPQGCQNGADCINTPGSFSCSCKPGWVGVHCTERYSDCSRSSAVELCDHGTCVNSLAPPGYTCICQQGWKTNGLTPACSVDINECEEAKPPCVSQCINLPGSFICGPCPAGFTGNGFACFDINECETNNGGCSISPRVACINSYGSFHCGDCPVGWTGDGKQCTRTETGSCSRNICHPVATCREISNLVVCSCPSGMAGDGIGPNGCTPDPCANRCKNGGTCIVNGTSYICKCPEGLLPPNCEPNINPCRANPCQNGGTCVVQGRRYRCLCPPRYRGRICQLVQTRCGGVLNSPSGVLKYPLTATYDPNVRCAWLIRTNITKVLEVTFNKFELESSVGCFFDWLQIHDGGTSAAQLIGRFCGSELPKGGKIISTHNLLYFWFRSDNSTAHNGFELTWKTIDPVCGGTLEINTYGTVASPGSPGNYSPNRDCEWHLIAPLGKRIQLTFFLMALEAHEDCGYDYLAIYDGSSRESSLLQKYCNTSHPAPIVSSSHEVTLYFHSDSDNTDAGFQIHYAVIGGTPGCGGIFTSSKAILKSPLDGGKYPPNLNCDYLIKLPLDNRIKLHFTKFALEYSDTCVYDYVEIYEGETDQDPKVGRYCGTTIPPDYMSESNAVLVKFITDFDDALEGFQIEYDTVCGGNFKEPEGVITSPMYPNEYAHDRICLYEIAAPQGKAVKIAFQDFDVEGPRAEEDASQCGYDFLEIMDGVRTTNTTKYCGTRIPPMFISKSNLLTLKLVADESLAGRGFKANYSFVNIGCGGILKDPHQLIKPPVNTELNDGSYQHNANCEWTIFAPAGYLIYLSWISFQLEQTSDCVYDYVEIYDNGTKIGRYCGSDKPPTLTSSANIVSIKFQSDISDSGEGFTATYHFLDSKKVCGGNYYTQSGVLTSPDYPAEYGSDKTCVWTISVPTGSQIELNVKKFELEPEPRCQYDYLEIRNGISDTSPLIGRFCGVDIPKRIPSFSNQLHLKFVSDYSSAGPGFEIEWDGTISGCGGKITSYRGSITSPNYPGPYDHNAQCDWRIIISKGSTIDIIIPELLLEPSSTCFYDYIEIYDGSGGASNHKIGRYCSSLNDIIHVKTTTNEALIRFVSDLSNANKGFHLSYSTNCNNEINDLQGVIESPNFPNFYPDSLQCKWVINGRKGSKIVVHISHIALEENYSLMEFSESSEPCPFDYIEIAEKSGTRFNLMKKICEATNETFETSATAMQITFKSDESAHGSGFRLEYRIEGCGGILTRPTGQLKSPDYPNNYPHNAYCEWIIEAEYGNLIELNVTDWQIEGIASGSCDFDGLLIANGKTSEHTIVVYCGESSGNSTIVRSNGNTMFVQFYSDASSRGRGFSAAYKQVPAKCGGVFRNSIGVIHSPNYPKNYEPNMDCEWLIQVDDFHSVQFGFNEFDLEPSPSCVHDSVEIYDGAEINPEKMLLKHCGSDLPNITVNSTKSNVMLVVLKTDSDTEFKGFVLHYSSNCGKRIYANNTGIIMSTPQLISEECVWTIVTDPGQHITFTTTHFEKSLGTALRNQVDVACPNGGLQFYDGDSVNAPLKKTFCTKFPDIIVSQGSALTIRLSLPIVSGFEGFYTVFENRCGGKLTSFTGKFSSPLYPNSYPVNVECVWTIEATPGNQLEFIVEELQIEQSDNCNQDYLEVREGGPLGKVLGVFCGTDAPPMMTGQSTLWVKFNSDDNYVGKGFIARYSYAFNVDITGMNGTLTSPRYPNAIKDFTPFSWRITVPRGYVIQGTFPDGRGEEINAFFNQKFMISNGYDETAAPLDLPQDAVSFTSSTSSIYITVVLPLFKINWRAVSKTEISANDTKDAECRSTITVGQLPILFSSPGFPSGYKPLLNCEWVVKSNTSVLRPTVHLLTVDLDDQFGCFADYLEVFTSKDMVKWNQAFKGCKLEPNQARQIAGDPYLKVTFNSDAFGNKTGISGVFIGKCGGEFTDASGVIDSSLFMETNTENECKWKIHVQRGRKIKFRFTRMALPKNAQGGCVSYVMLSNGEDEESPILGVGKYCGTEIPDVPLTTSNRAFVKFKNAYPSGSWKLSYETVMNECEHNIILSETLNSTSISTENFPHIPTPHSVCTWTILAPLGEHIQVHFHNFNPAQDLNCQNEYFEILDGATALSKQLVVNCTQPNSIDSTANAMRIKYFSDTTDPSLTFNATVSIGKCGGTYHDRSGTITSKNYPHLGQYPSNSICEYRILLPVGAIINITFIDINLPAGDCKTVDNLEVSYIAQGIENSTETTKYNFCGGYTLPYLVINDNEALLRFQTFKPNTVYRGFKLSYTSSLHGCGGFINAEQGIIMTPGYPNGWGNTAVCIWKITVPKGRRIKMEFLDYDVPTSHQGFAVFRPMQRRASRIGLFNDHRYLSGIGYYYTSPPSVVYSSDNQMLVSCWLLPAPGFRGIKMRYSSNERTICQGSLKDTFGLIALPAVNTSLICSYEVQTNGTETIAFTFNDFRVDRRMMRLPCELRPPVSILDETGTKMRLCQNTTETTLRSPFLTTKLQVLQLLQTKIISFNMTYKRHNCGGIVSLNDPYKIISPLVTVNSSTSYGTLDCAWLVAKSTKDAFLFKISGFVKLKLGCDKEYLSIKQSPTGPHLGRICGDMTITNMSTLSQAFIEYHADTFSADTVVNITIEDIDECEDHVFNAPHTIHLKDDYKSNVECIWTIKSNSGYHLQAEFIDRFYIEDSANCSKDVLKIYDYVDGDWVLLDGVCGRTRPPVFNSTENVLRLKFKSDESVEGDGFTVHFGNKCGGVYFVQSNKHIITSPNYPEKYNDNLECNYTLVAPSPEDVILVQFTDFEIENIGKCQYDNVTIYAYNYNSYEKLGTYCTDSSISELRHKDRISIVFKTDANGQRKGFRFEYSLDRCGGVVSHSQLISSPKDNGSGAGRMYPPNAHCVWNITAPKDKEIIIKFEHLEVEVSSRCYYDYVAIFKGSKELESNKVATLCGNLTGKLPTVNINTNHAIIHFHTDPSNSDRGFSAWVLFKDQCDRTITLDANSPSYIFDKFYGSTYQTNLDCNYVFSAPDGYHIQVDFDQFHVAPCTGNQTDTCSCDYLELRDGAGPFSELIGRFCGHELPPAAISTRTKMFLKFVSDSTTTSNGIKATFKLVASRCGPTNHILEDAQGITLQTPGDVYPPNLRCLWKIHSTKYHLHLHFTKFDLQGPDDKGQCTKDVLQIYTEDASWTFDNGLDSEIVRNGIENGVITTYADSISRNPEGRLHYCGNSTPTDYFSNSNTVYVIFKSDEDVQKSGVKFSATPISGCYKNYTGIQGRIFLNSYLDCEFYILAPENYTITLYFNAYYALDDDCNKQYFAVYDGDNGTEISRKCGQLEPASSIFSNTNHLKVKVKNTGMFSNYDATFLASNAGPGCGGRLRNYGGIFTSPLYPLNTRNTSDCRWDIEVPSNMKVALVFDVFDMGARTTCPSDYLQIIELEESGEEVVRRFCGEDKPSPYRGRRNTIAVKYRKSVNFDGTGWVLRFGAINDDTKLFHFNN